MPAKKSAAKKKPVAKKKPAAKKKSAAKKSSKKASKSGITWLQHVKNTYNKHNCKLGEAMKMAKKTWPAVKNGKKVQTGGEERL